MRREIDYVAPEGLTLTETVVKVNFQDGDLVEAGDVLVDLSGRVEVAGLAEFLAVVDDRFRNRAGILGNAQQSPGPAIQLYVVISRQVRQGDQDILCRTGGIECEPVQIRGGGYRSVKVRADRDGS